MIAEFISPEILGIFLIAVMLFSIFVGFPIFSMVFAGGVIVRSLYNKGRRSQTTWSGPSVNGYVASFWVCGFIFGPRIH